MLFSGQGVGQRGEEPELHYRYGGQADRERWWH